MSRAKAYKFMNTLARFTRQKEAIQEMRNNAKDKVEKCNLY